ALEVAARLPQRQRGRRGRLHDGDADGGDHRVGDEVADHLDERVPLPHDEYPGARDDRLRAAEEAAADPDAPEVTAEALPRPDARQDLARTEPVRLDRGGGVMIDDLHPRLQALDRQP